MLEQIPTPAPHWKDKIGRHLSYPLKFSEVQSALAPAFESLGIEVWFVASDAPRQNQVLAKYLVCEARYRPYRLSTVAPAGPQWQFWIHPVPRNLRQLVRASLIPDALERVKRWFSGPHSSVWLAAQKEFRVRFVPAAGALAYEPA